MVQDATLEEFSMTHYSSVMANNWLPWCTGSIAMRARNIEYDTYIN